MGCLPECAPEFPELDFDACNDEIMKGGILALFFMKCDAAFDEVSGESIADIAVWNALRDSGDLVLSGEVIGSKPKSTATRLRTKSCSPERVVSRQGTINFRDYNADLTNLTQYDFWSFIDENYGNLKFGYITCEGYAYGPFDNRTWSIDVDDVREETSEQPVNFDGVITYDKLTITKPVLVPGLPALVQ